MTLHDLAMIGAGMALGLVLEGGALVLVVAVMWYRHERALGE